MIVEIATGVLGRLRRAAAASPEAEICGLLLGQRGRIERAAPTANISPHPADSFEIDPAALIAAHRAERGGGERLLGHYHSHPTGSPYPSARDKAAAEPGRLWLILGCHEALLWHVDENSTFQPVGLTEHCAGAPGSSQALPLASPEG